MKTWLLAFLLAQSGGGDPEWFLDVRHDHAFGECRGQLIVTDESVRYETSVEEHTRNWSYPEIELFEIVSDQEIRLHTYENHGVFQLWQQREFRLELEGGQVDGELHAFLRVRSPRPLLSRVVFQPPKATTVEPDGTAEGDRLFQELPVKHEHRFGGCQGTLAIREEWIVYRADEPKDSRMWWLQDVESFASIDNFDLRISTRDETFHFKLKLPLDRGAYQHIWRAVYAPQIQNYRGRAR